MKDAVYIIAFLCLILYFQNKDAENKDYVSGLEKVVNTCTNDREGTLVIDGEIYLCGVARTGIRF